MEAAIFEAFETICAQIRDPASVLEVGAVPQADTLLRLQAFQNAKEKIGISLEHEGLFGDFQIRKQSAHDLSVFPTDHFDAVVCNSVLEHDPAFWKSLSEMKRVCRPGGLIALGVPGYAVIPETYWLRKLRRWARKIHRPAPWSRRLRSLMASTPTLVVHNYPGDYYRFSEQAVREVFLGGLERVEVLQLMDPPRFVGHGFKPAA